jgi:hypothetical protein
MTPACLVSDDKPLGKISQAENRYKTTRISLVGLTYCTTQHYWQRLAFDDAIRFFYKLLVLGSFKIKLSAESDTSPDYEAIQAWYNLQRKQYYEIQEKLREGIANWIENSSK